MTEKSGEGESSDSEVTDILPDGVTDTDNMDIEANSKNTDSEYDEVEELSDGED